MRIGRHLLVFVAVAGVTVAALLQASWANAPPMPTLSITTETQLRLEVEGRAPKILTDNSQVVGELTGTERSECRDYGRPSHARADSAVFLVDETGDRVTLQLKVNVHAAGGHYRRCGQCVLGNCLAIFPRDTRGLASSRAQATLRVRLPPQTRTVPWFLEIQTNQTDDDLSISIVGPNAAKLESVPGLSARYLLDGEANDEFFVNAVLSKSVSNEGGCCSDESSDSILLTARLEQAPVLYSTMLEPYIRGGTVTTAYPEVGVIRLDGLPHCTGTLIGRKTVLTAAHCIAGFEKQINEGRFSFGQGVSATKPDEVHEITNGVYPNDPDKGFVYNFVTNEDDIGLLYLSEPVDSALIPLHAGVPSWETLKPLSLLFVGYGYNVIHGERVGIGIKREAEWTIDRVKNRVIEWDVSEVTTCKGDSGGPTLFTNPTSLVLVAVTSVGDDACTLGRNTRVDPYVAWIQPQIQN